MITAVITHTTLYLPRAVWYFVCQYVKELCQVWLAVYILWQALRPVLLAAQMSLQTTVKRGTLYKRAPAGD
jgi:hypothetical protein